MNFVIIDLTHFILALSLHWFLLNNRVNKLICCWYIFSIFVLFPFWIPGYKEISYVLVGGLFIFLQKQ